MNKTEKTRLGDLLDGGDVEDSKNAMPSTFSTTPDTELALEVEPMDEMRKALKPCPFCGGEADYRNFGSDGQMIVCSDCESGTGFKNTEAEVISSWNHRPAVTSPWEPDPRIPERLKNDEWVHQLMGRYDSLVSRPAVSVGVPSVGYQVNLDSVKKTLSALRLRMSRLYNLDEGNIHLIAMTICDNLPALLTTTPVPAVGVVGVMGADIVQAWFQWMAMRAGLPLSKEEELANLAARIDALLTTAQGEVNQHSAWSKANPHVTSGSTPTDNAKVRETLKDLIGLMDGKEFKEINDHEDGPHVEWYGSSDSWFIPMEKAKQLLAALGDGGGV